MKIAFNEPSKQGPNPEAWKVLQVNFATDVGTLAHASQQRISSDTRTI